MTSRSRCSSPPAVRGPRALGAALTLALAVWAGTALAPAALAQPAPERGPREVDPRWHAIVGATVVPEPGRSLEDATIVLRDGVITEVGPGIEAPAGARVHDGRGLTVYAGFIDPYVPVEAAMPSADSLAAVVV